MAKKIGEILVAADALSAPELERALSVQASTQPRRLLGATLLALGLIDESARARALAAQANIPAWDLQAAPPDPELRSLLPAALAQACGVIPQGRENGAVRCVAAGPVGPADRARVEFVMNLPMRLAIAPESDVNEWLNKLYGVSVESVIAGLSRTSGGDSDEPENQLHDLRALAEEPTLVNLVNMIIKGAIDERASDIHIEPFEASLQVRYRIDGILHEMPPPPKQFQSAIVSRLKIMAEMDIAERFIPQDGQIRVSVEGTEVDIRASTVPTVYGETVVLRLLRKDESLLKLTNLGLSEATHQRLSALLHRPFGIILTCGPTGSGKSTTLYGSLMEIYTPARKIITIEDPVEYKIHGVNQIPVRPKRGLTFATGLRAIVRQDPDIIMVGEIRDKETAEIAIRSALTGHLVLSTLHTNDAPGAITRLLDMGIEPFLVASSLQGALGQRLVRRLCPRCRRPAAPEPGLAARFGVERLPNHIYEAAVGGCDECHGRGFRGRIGIYELLTMNDDLHELVLQAASSARIKQAAIHEMTSMREDGWSKICAGITSAAEVLQAVQAD